MAYLVVTFDGKELMRRKLDAPVTVGRSLDCDVAIEDLAVSRHHCRIQPEGERWIVVDLNSRNGTKVNGHRIERTALKENDVIAVGHARLMFHAGRFVGPRPTDPSAALLSESAGPIESRRDAPKKPLPTPKIGRVDTVVMPSPEPGQKPLPFTRPPAKPIVKPQEDED